MRNDPLGHVAEVGGALAHVAAHAAQDVLERLEGREDRSLGVRAGVDLCVDVIEDRGILSHEGLRLENGLRVSAGCRASRAEISSDERERLADSGLGAGRVALERVWSGSPRVRPYGGRGRTRYRDLRLHRSVRASRLLHLG